MLLLVWVPWGAWTCTPQGSSSLGVDLMRKCCCNRLQDLVCKLELHEGYPKLEAPSFRVSMQNWGNVILFLGSVCFSECWRQECQDWQGWPGLMLEVHHKGVKNSLISRLRVASCPIMRWWQMIGAAGWLENPLGWPYTHNRRWRNYKQVGWNTFETSG